jgi:hypothetical protein
MKATLNPKHPVKKHIHHTAALFYINPKEEIQWRSSGKTCSSLTKISVD